MSEELTYTGIVREVGGKEMAKNGKTEKPRKIVISDSPDYAGKTFRVWVNSSDFLVLQSALNSGEEVTVTYEVNPIPGTTYSQNMILNASTGQPSGDWSTPAKEEEAPAAAPPQRQHPPAATQSTPPSQPLSKDDYWEQRAADEARRESEIEAAWAVGKLVESDPQGSLSAEQVIANALHLIDLKRQVAAKLRNSPGGTLASTSDTKLDGKSPGREVKNPSADPVWGSAGEVEEVGDPTVGEAQAVPSDDGETPTVDPEFAEAFVILESALDDGRIGISDVIKAALMPCHKANVTPPTKRHELEDLPGHVLKQIVSKLADKLNLVEV